MSTVPIQIRERSGIGRTYEPVSFGIPIPKGMLKDPRLLRLTDGLDTATPLQTEVLAHWPDGSIKWALLDFQASLSAGEQAQYSVECGVEGETVDPGIRVNWGECLQVDTGQAVFHIDMKRFRPFTRVVVRGRDVLASSSVVLEDDRSRGFEPEIRHLAVETEGPIRSTVLMEGVMSSGKGDAPLNFVARLHFFAGKATVKVDFTLHNPRAARHPGGLWDLGDPGSFFFRDLSFSLALKGAGQERSCRYRLEDGDDPERVESHTINGTESPLKIYQDSSGGENWHSRNHINKDGQITTVFRGFKLFEGGREVAKGNRPWPEMAVRTETGIAAGAIRYFWQNFPNRLMADENRLFLSPFPDDARYPYELQGGEQKTHEMFLSFGGSEQKAERLDWIRSPLTPVASPEWFANSGAIPYLTAIDVENPPPLFDLVQTAVKGDNTFLHRREVIDEYGWRNFGDLYADHEAVGHDGPEPLISHYNNQYDCIYGMLMQYMATGNPDWFVLADQLAAHVKDIDIYHTDKDRPEYNHGMFWHTEHYIDAETATHRCFSERHGEKRDLSAYGGGPSLSHVYATGLMFHFFLTGDKTSREAVIELADFVVNNIEMDATVSNWVIQWAKNLKNAVSDIGKPKALVQLNKVYGLDGPGRASGNSLNVLLDAYCLNEDFRHLSICENLIRSCVRQDEDIEKRDLLDAENRWMYLVFLQSLGKYLFVKSGPGIHDEIWDNSKIILVKYAIWIYQNERPYLEETEKLEYPNETWAVQDFRKSIVLLMACLHSEKKTSEQFYKKAVFLFREGMKYLLKFDTANLTRPLALALLNLNAYDYLCSEKYYKVNIKIDSHLNKKDREIINDKYRRPKTCNFSFSKEIAFLKSRFHDKLWF